MKKIILSIAVLTSGFIYAQVNDSVALGMGYANQSFYSLADGEVGNEDNGNWDLAFDASPFGSTIRLNRRINEVFLASEDETTWETIDTAGMAEWPSYINGYDSWTEGALNAPADLAVPEDLGWGIYNTITHATEGNRIFVVKFGDGSVKKLWIQSLASGAYTFRFANLDNTEDETASILKGDYSTKNFAYYSLATASVIDREPATGSWDLLFTNYVLELAPGYISGVTGVISNYETTIYVAAEMPVDDAEYDVDEFETSISTIGYDWKSFDFDTYTYNVVADLSYFVQTQHGEIYQIVFTGFNGSSDGKSYFTKTKVTFASLVEEEVFIANIYPNPANHKITIDAPVQGIQGVKIYNVNGQMVYADAQINGQHQVHVDVNELPEGFYVVQITDNANQVITKKISVVH